MTLTALVRGTLIITLAVLLLATCTAPEGLPL